MAISKQNVLLAAAYSRNVQNKSASRRPAFMLLRCLLQNSKVSEKYWQRLLHLVAWPLAWHYLLRPHHECTITDDHILANIANACKCSYVVASNHQTGWVHQSSLTPTSHDSHQAGHNLSWRLLPVTKQCGCHMWKLRINIDKTTLLQSFRMFFYICFYM